MRTELDVPFSHKDEAKALGAKWDRVKKIWYVPDGVNPEPFAAWLPGVDRSDPARPTSTWCWASANVGSVTSRRRSRLGIPYWAARTRAARLRPAQRLHGRRWPHRNRHRPRQRHSHRLRAGLRAGRDPRLPARALRLQTRTSRTTKPYRSPAPAPPVARCKAAITCSRSPRRRLHLRPSTSCPRWSSCAWKSPASMASLPPKATSTRRSSPGHATTTPSSTRACSRGSTCRAKLENRVQISLENRV